jgi:hypothetical protein
VKSVKLLLLVGLALAGAACGPAAPRSTEGRAIIPEVPQVANEVLRQQLNTLRALVSEYAKLSEPGAPNDEKTAGRVSLLKQGVSEFRTKCTENLDKAGESRGAVEDFLDRCASVMQGA